MTVSISKQGIEPTFAVCLAAWHDLGRMEEGCSTFLPREIHVMASEAYFTGAVFSLFTRHIWDGQSFTFIRCYPVSKSLKMSPHLSQVHLFPGVFQKTVYLLVYEMRNKDEKHRNQSFVNKEMDLYPFMHSCII